MARIRVNGVDLHVEERGRGAPILGIHGTPSSAALWADAAERLAERGRCLTYDRRGFVRSAGAEADAATSLDDHVADAAALLDQADATPAAVVGRSTGGLIALELARRHPEAVSALVLLEPALFTTDAAARAWAAEARDRIAATAAEHPDRAAEAVFRVMLGDEAWTGLPADVRGAFAAANGGVLAELAGDGLDLSARPRRYEAGELEAVRAPTLVVVAESSPEPLHRAAGWIVDRIPGARRSDVAGGHLIDPADPAVLAFLDAHAA
ncbi:3-oxoadipate enol-lactonase [Agromyces luteolus]|uniref:Alpha/beta fold hydrolase n=1 Tax=Agromyces luteolus TaxID=88373 RepID=A0A7C9LET3_9MICO|nr:alpha/beta fold hydrolase [Agromyces luteolus]MUN08912.1 alpha/beta fold hydrolase [Agromyces luteolus]GLK28275.1 3-oxoadipate enol-lactonase [Agromyces luteolus]